MDDVMQLGGNIELSGFRDLDNASMIVLKKVVGNYAKRMSELAEKFEKLSLVMKAEHEGEKSGMLEIQAELMNNGKAFVSDAAEKNLFIAVDNALKKIVSQIS